MKIFFTLATAFTLLLNTNLCAQVNINDSLALVDLYNNTQGNGWMTKTNWLSGPVSSWFGITVIDKRVTSIALASNNINGTLPASFSNLKNLQYLNLSRNYELSGVGFNIFSLVNLRHLDLSYCHYFTGYIPEEIGALTQLHYLNLRSSSFGGALPATMGNLVLLDTLDLSTNGFTSTLPPSLGNLSKLLSLNLSQNQFTGNLPSELGNLNKLKLFNVSLNYGFRGGIPSSFGNMDSLEQFNVGDCGFDGTIPPSLGKLKKLISFEGYNCNFTGSLPAALAGMKNLLSFQVFNNNLQGKIPPEFARLKMLQYLDLAYNNFSGTIPDSLFLMPSLQYLYLENNRLSGAIPKPSKINNKLRAVGLHANRLSGSIPAEISNLTRLKSLTINGNKLSGTIPASINNMMLNELFIEKNNFTFAGMEQLAQTFPKARYAPQGLITVQKNADKLYVSAGGSLSNNKYKWFKNGKLTATVTGDSTFKITGPGEYYVTVFNAIATDTLQKTRKLILRSDTIEISDALFSVATQNALKVNPSQDFAVYPNPAKDHITVQLPASISDKAYISIYDAAGKLVLRRKPSHGSQQNLSLNTLPAGSFTIVLDDENIIKGTLKFIHIK